MSYINACIYIYIYIYVAFLKAFPLLTSVYFGTIILKKCISGGNLNLALGILKNNELDFLVP